MSYFDMIWGSDFGGPGVDLEGQGSKQGGIGDLLSDPPGYPLGVIARGVISGIHTCQNLMTMSDFCQ